MFCVQIKFLAYRGLVRLILYVFRNIFCLSEVGKAAAAAAAAAAVGKAAVAAAAAAAGMAVAADAVAAVGGAVERQ
jgi:hypothetical protein